MALSKKMTELAKKSAGVKYVVVITTGGDRFGFGGKVASRSEPMSFAEAIKIVRRHNDRVGNGDPKVVGNAKAELA